MAESEIERLDLLVVCIPLTLAVVLPVIGVLPASDGELRLELADYLPLLLLLPGKFKASPIAFSVAESEVKLRRVQMLQLVLVAASPSSSAEGARLDSVVRVHLPAIV